ncbi:uncharacterized protein LOC144866188 isoform X2 [Branchiostoma floridae x Branchiostoma japonicum]
MSSTLTGVCGLSWEVTMSVLPRLYIEEVLSELQRRKIAVAREKVRHSDLLRLLHEVMVREYEQLQQHLRTFYIHTEKEFSPQTRAQEIHYVHGHQRNLPGSQGSHGNASQGVARNFPNQEKSPTMAVQENIPAQTVAKDALPGNLQGMQGVCGNSSQGIVQNSPNQGISPITERQQSLQPCGNANNRTSQNVSQKSPDQLVQGPSPITSMQQILQAQRAQAAHQAQNTSAGNLPRIQSVYSTASQSILQNSSNQQRMALITATQHNHPVPFPQAMEKKSSPGNVRETEDSHGNASQSLAQNSPNPLVQGIPPTVASSTQHHQGQLLQTVRTLKNSLAGNLGGRQSNTQQSVTHNTPGQPVQGTSPTTATHQSLKAHFAQSLANLQNNLPGIKPSIVTTRTGAPVHGKSFTYSQPSRPQMQVSPQVQSSPQAMPPQLAQMIRNGPNLLNTPTGLLRGHANPVVKFPSRASAGQPSSPTAAPIDPVAWARSFSSTMKSQQEAESGQQGLQKGVVTNSNSSNSIHANLLGEFPSAARQPSPQPPGSQTDTPIDQCAWARTFSIAMKSQQEVVSGHQGLQKGVATNSSHDNTSPGVVQSSPNQPERGSSPETATPLQNLQTQLEQAVQEARNSLPGASMPSDVHAGQGGVGMSSISDTSFTMAQTVQATSVQDSNTSPYDVGQANLISEPMDDRTKNPDHHDVQGTCLTNNCDATTDVSFHSAATNAEREEDEYADTTSSNATTQESVASQQMLLTLNQQSASENTSKTPDMHDSIRQQLPEQDSTQSSQNNGREHSVQEPSETENTHNLPSSNVVVKIEQEDDYWSVPCTTSTANSRVSDSPSPCVVVKTEKDDNIETDSALPLDYSAGTSMERSTTVRTENDLEEAWRQERLDDHSSPEQSQVTTSTPVQQVIPQGLPMTHTDQQESTSTSLTLSESLTIGTTSSQESRHYAVQSSAGLPDLDMNAYEFRDNSRNLSQKRKTVQALLDDLKKAKQLKSDGVTNEEDPMGIVSAMKDWREGRRNSQTNRREDVGPSVTLVGEGSVQQLRTGNMQGGEQFPLASAEANSTARAPRGVLHKCMFCPFETRLKTNLQYHLRDHAEINVYRCGMCSFSAATKQTLDDHVATRHHEELPFMCGVCGYRTGVKENLSTHMWVVHKAGKSFQCSLCEYSTSYKTRLETHMINHHF